MKGNFVLILFGVGLLLLAAFGQFEDEKLRYWAAGLGAGLLALSVMLTPRPPR